MSRSFAPRLLLPAAALLLLSFAAHEVLGFGNAALDDAFDAWFQPAVFLGCGLATLLRGSRVPAERSPWLLLGTGLVLYAIGSVYYNIGPANDPSPPFPSAADGLWLMLYPLTFAAIVQLVRHRFVRISASVWLDGIIGGTVVAALAAGIYFEPVFGVAADNGVASAARLAYPLADTVALGFIIVVWSLGGRRFS